MQFWGEIPFIILLQKFAYRVSVSNKHLFEPFCVWILQKNKKCFQDTTKEDDMRETNTSLQVISL